MKKILIGLLALGSISVFAGEIFIAASSDSNDFFSKSSSDFKSDAEDLALEKCRVSYTDCTIVKSAVDTAYDNQKVFSFAAYGTKIKNSDNIVLD